MSHTSSYKSMVVIHDGDYAGDYKIMYPPPTNYYHGGNAPSYDNNSLEVTIDSKKFDSICRKLIKGKTFSRDLTYKVTDGNKSLNVSSVDMVDFFLDKLRFKELSRLETMERDQLIKRYF